MTLFLIKSAIAMGVLLGLYYILFEREKMHRFNRFYLLSALVFSLTLPFITVITYIKKINIPQGSVTIAAPTAINTIQTEQPIDYAFYIGWGIYAVVSLILLFRFIRNTQHFFRKATVNPSVKMGTANLILLEEKILPHTFLNYIFINRDEYEARTIEDELYTHELTHVNQKHTLDILFIEALKIVFWFNPLLYCYKKAVQLNHEFLADEKVIDTTTNTVYYQNLLLEKATVGTTFSMASNLTFSLTKKRFIMMTKTTSRIKSEILKLSVLPVAFALILILSNKTNASVSSTGIDKQETLIRDSIEMVTYKPNPDDYYAGVRFIFYKTGHWKKENTVGKDPYFDKVYEEITDEEKKEHAWLFMTPTPLKKQSPTQKEMNGFKNKKNYAIWVDGIEIENSTLNNYKPKDIAYFSGSVILKNARTKEHPQPFQYWLFTHNHFEKNEMHKVRAKYSESEIHLYNKLS